MMARDIGVRPSLHGARAGRKPTGDPGGQPGRMLPSMSDDLWPGEYRNCPMCTNPLEARPHMGRTRMVCGRCGWVHFRDPGVGAAVLVKDDEGRVLLVKRGPQTTKSGLWCIPCGYVDYGEDVVDAAARELREETGLVVSVGEPVQVASNFHDPAKVTVGIWFEGTVTGGAMAAGDDAVDVGWFHLDELPALAFDTDQRLLARLREE